jgi:hypothetical protein
MCILYAVDAMNPDLVFRRSLLVIVVKRQGLDHLDKLASLLMCGSGQPLFALWRTDLRFYSKDSDKSK